MTSGRPRPWKALRETLEPWVKSPTGKVGKALILRRANRHQGDCRGNSRQAVVRAPCSPESQGACVTTAEEIRTPPPGAGPLPFPLPWVPPGENPETYDIDR